MDTTNKALIPCARAGCPETFEPKLWGGPLKVFCSRNCSAAARRVKTPEKTQEACARWRVKNPDKVKTYSSEYYTANHERIKAAQAGRRAEHPDKIKAYTFANREKTRIRMAAQQAHAYAMLAQKFGPVCQDCGVGYPMGVYHYHHIDPNTRPKGCLNTQFGWARADAYTDGTMQLCPTCHVLRHRRERLERANAKRDTNYSMLFEKFGEGCADCGKVFPAGAYQYHHLDPQTKAGKLRIEGWKWPRVDAYTDGTTQLCPTCHTLRHYYERKQPSA